MDTSSEREGLHWVKVARFLSLPFSPASVKTYLRLERFEDLPIDRLVADGIQGVLLDADGTLGPHHSTVFAKPVLAHIRALVARGLRVAVYTNASEHRFGQMPEVRVVTGVPPKPDRRGFEIALREFLELEDPDRVCMVGDNYITDGGAVMAGMRFIHVRPVPGGENPFHRFTRGLAERIARWHAGD